MTASTVCGSTSLWWASIACATASVLAVPAREVAADERVRALDLVRDRLADVVQQRRAAGGLGADAPSSSAMIAARCAHSTECASTFWP